MMLTEIYELIYTLGGFVCHQAPERSFHIAGAQLPLCVRCTMLLLGAVGAGVTIGARRSLPSMKLSFFLALPMAAEIVLSVSGLIQVGNAVRAVTGFLFGFFFLIGALQLLANLGPGVSPRIQNRSQPLLLVFVSFLTILT
jgi:uncharacterized membrane protein